jgi:hypothetical protein
MKSTASKPGLKVTEHPIDTRFGRSTITRRILSNFYQIFAECSQDRCRITQCYKIYGKIILPNIATSLSLWYLRAAIYVKACNFARANTYIYNLMKRVRLSSWFVHVFMGYFPPRHLFHGNFFRSTFLRCF